ncbi:MAG: hypothetical protein WAO77_06945 [Sphingobium sp.]
MTGLAALAVALIILWAPVGLVEMVVASSGLSEAVPAAAPPLGLKARLMLAGFGALMAAGVVSATRRSAGRDEPQRIEEGRQDRVQGAKTMGFAFSKLTALARGRAAANEADAPVLRRADAHPDAPPRPPIFASRDFDGLEIFGRPEGSRRPLVANPEPQPESVLPPPPFAMPSAPAPLSEAELPQPAFARAPAAAPAFAEPPRFAAPIAVSPPEVEPAPTPAPLPLRLPTQGLSVSELTERLERGLAQRSRATVPPVAGRGVIADMPAAQPVPVREAVAQDTDEALRAALGALRSMAGRR